VVGSNERVPPPPGAAWPEEAAVGAFLAQHRPALDALYAAAKLEGEVRYPVQYSRGIGALLPHAQKLRGAARLLVLDAHDRARAGDHAGATESLVGMLRAAATLEDEPVLISQLVRMAMLNSACQELERLLPHVHFNEPELQALQQALAASRSRRPLADAFAGERVLGLESFRSNQPGMEGGPAWQFTRGTDTLYYLDLMGRMEAAAEEPWPQALAALGKIEQEVAALAASPLERARRPMTILLLPALKTEMEAGARNEAFLAAAETALAVERFRRAEGKMPAQLAQLVPAYLAAVPQDVFNGKPLRFVVAAEKYVVYSVGLDQKDDGGAGDASGKPDVAFKVLLLPGQ
jgi:hypothetical protein